VRDSNEKSRATRGFLESRVKRLVSEALKIALSQLCRRCPGILGNDLLQNAFDLVGMTQSALNISELVQGIRHLGMLGVQLTHFGEGLTGTLQIAFGQIHFA
jgi:hypothetical protein